MKYNRIFRILALAIILSLLMLAIPATPALAQAEYIYISPSRGEIGADIGISGYYFDVNERVYIYFSSHEADEGDDIDDLDAYERVVSANTGATGAVDEGRFDTTFEVPDELTDGGVEEKVHGGDYYIYATYTSEGEIEALRSFTVIAIELDPELGNVGDEIKISGAGFRANRDIAIDYDDDDIEIVDGDEETDSDGEFSLTIIIPESTVGDHTISVKAYYEAEVEFTVEPKITISSSSGAIGDTVTVNGTGFSKRKDVTIYFNDVIMTLTSGTDETDSDGSFENLKFNVPVVGAGTYNIKAEDTANETAIATFEVESHVSLTPATSQNSPGHVGTELTVSGTGFIPGRTVTIKYYITTEDTEEITTTVKTDGTFSATFNAPASPGGDHTITASVDTITISKTFYMESTPPAIPAPLLPLMDSTIEKEVELRFDWKDVEDPSGVTYTLHIASDDKFTSTVLDKAGLTNSEYTLTEEEKEKLVPTEEKEAVYYWQVKAIDGASNGGEWSGAGSFFIPRPGFFFAMPQWAIYTFFGLLALLLGVFGFWLGRRTVYSAF